jgi:hypothetical protein
MTMIRIVTMSIALLLQVGKPVPPVHPLESAGSNFLILLG